MAFYDWNRDGKKDIQDDYLEYKIYQESTKKDDSGNSGNNYSGGPSDGSGCGFWFWFCVIMIILGIITNWD